MPFVFFNSVLAHMLKFTQLQKPIQIKECVIQSCIISFGTTNKVQIKSLTLMVIFSQWKVKKSLSLHYLLELALLNDSQTAIPSLQIKKKCNMHHTSRKDDDAEPAFFWTFSRLLSTFFIISDTMHTDEVRPKRNNRSEREKKSFTRL